MLTNVSNVVNEIIDHFVSYHFNDDRRLEKKEEMFNKRRHVDNNKEESVVS